MADPLTPADDGEVVLRDVALESVELDVARGNARLCLADGRRVDLLGLRATTLLGPWDGRSGVVEWLKVVARLEGTCCLELRVRFGEIPRVYRIVCEGLHLG